MPEDKLDSSSDREASIRLLHRYLYPVGFKTSRMYSSTLYRTPNGVLARSSTVATRGPIFRVSHKAARRRAWNAPDIEVESDASVVEEVTFEAGTPSAVWLQVLLAVNKAKKLNGIGGPYPTAVSGPEMYGISHEDVIGLCQTLEGVDAYVDAGYELKKENVTSIEWGEGPFASRARLPVCQEKS